LGFVAHRPGDNLAHALHLVEARKVQQDREAGEKLQALGEGEEASADLPVGMSAPGG
jgi:hypothetical protein